MYWDTVWRGLCVCVCLFQARWDGSSGRTNRPPAEFIFSLAEDEQQPSVQERRRHDVDKNTNTHSDRKLTDVHDEQSVSVCVCVCVQKPAVMLDGSRPPSVTEYCTVFSAKHTHTHSEREKQDGPNDHRSDHSRVCCLTEYSLWGNLEASSRGRRCLHRVRNGMNHNVALTPDSR